VIDYVVVGGGTQVQRRTRWR